MLVSESFAPVAEIGRNHEQGVFILKIRSQQSTILSFGFVAQITNKNGNLVTERKKKEENSNQGEGMTLHDCCNVRQMHFKTMFLFIHLLAHGLESSCSLQLFGEGDIDSCKSDTTTS